MNTPMNIKVSFGNRINIKNIRSVKCFFKLSPGNISLSSYWLVHHLLFV